MYHIIDLFFQEYEHTIATFLIETKAGPLLIESGPHSTLTKLEEGLTKYGYKLKDIKHVLLTHIHFDHAGAAWALAKAGAHIHVHPFGASHLHNPTKLISSASKIYGKKMDILWGMIKGIPKSNIKLVEHGKGLRIGGEVFYGYHTPGHAKHHVAWLWNDMCFVGDLAGVKINNGPVVPPCPPPDINIEDWHRSLNIILDKNPNKLILTHYAEELNPNIHTRALKEELKKWSEWVKDKLEQGLSLKEMIPLFTKYTSSQLKSEGLNERRIKQYEAANPSWMSVAGLARYWNLKKDARI